MTPEPSLEAPSPGTVLHDRYRIVRRIGVGGMGAVFEAIDTRLQNTVAVKQAAVSHPLADRAFEREAKVLAALRHPALPVVIDYFADPRGLFLVMQFIDGDDLSRVLRRQEGACAPGDVVCWALTVLDALAYLHAQDPPVVHRDVKPANLRRTPRGEIVLLDFGLAKTRFDSETRLGTEGSLFGYTPAYAPPEQVTGGGTDARSDLYALAATVYHLVLALAPPGASDRLAAIRDGRPDLLVSPHLVNPQVGEPLSAVLMRALALDPAERFASAIEMRDALRALESGALPRRDALRPAAGARRIDAAMPSQTEVGRQADLIVQVRFAESPLLGLEDWPTRRRPDRIEQGSEPLRVVHPIDPVTGAMMAARLRIAIVAPDFVIGGETAHVVDVPPDEYSKRLAFLLTPRRAGFCRVNVEVFSADAVLLGSIPVEVEAAAASASGEAGVGVGESEIRVANLVLEVLARRAGAASADSARAELAARAAPPDFAAIAEAAAMATSAPRAVPARAEPVAMAAPAPRAHVDRAAVAAPAPRAEPAAMPPPKSQFMRPALYISVAAIGLALAVVVWLPFQSYESAAPAGAVATGPATAPAPELVAAASPVPPAPMGTPAPPAAGSAASPPRSRSAATPGPAAPRSGSAAPAPVPAAQAPPVPVPATAAPPPTPTPSPVLKPTPALPPPPPAPLPTLSRPAPPPPPAVADDQSRVRSTLDALATAYSNMDVDAIVRVWPTAPAAQLRATFATYRSNRVTLSNLSISLDGDRATVTGSETTMTVVNTSDGPRNVGGTRQVTWRLRKANGVWLVVDRTSSSGSIVSSVRMSRLQRSLRP